MLTNPTKTARLLAFLAEPGKPSPLTTREDVWDWFGNHAAFLGGAPMTAGYCAAAMTDPETTPFERLYFAPSRPGNSGFVALRLRPNASKDRRIYDSMEVVMGRYVMDDKAHGLVIYPLPAKPNKWPPEPYGQIGEAEFLALGFEGCERWV